MSLRAVHPDCVTENYIEAHRLGVFIQTPLENVAFFRAEHKSVVAYTKNNGSYTLQLPLHEIEATLKDQATLVHRSVLVMNHMLPGIKHWRADHNWVLEIICFHRMGDRQALVPYTLPISRRLNAKVRAVIHALSAGES